MLLPVWRLSRKPDSEFAIIRDTSCYYGCNFKNILRNLFITSKHQLYAYKLSFKEKKLCSSWYTSKCIKLQMPERTLSLWFCHEYIKYNWNNLLRNVSVTFFTFCILATHLETSPFNQMFDFYINRKNETK